MASIKEIYHISDIREVYSEEKESLTVRLVEGSQPLKFTVSKADELVKVIGTVLSRWQNQQPSRYMSERKLEPKDVPGTFLNLALLNLGCTDAGLRVAAYKLLSGVKQAFHLRISYQLEASHDLCVPMNTAPFVMTVSKELAQKEPHLTLEFLSEVVAGFQQYSPALKQFCLAYLSPWLPNLSLSLCEATATEHEKLIRLVDMLVALTISEDAIYPLIQSYVWAKIGAEPKVLKGVLDSFIRMGISDGLGSRKLEVLADTAVTLEQSANGAVVTEVIKKMLKV
jgi:neurofibromin 1